MAADHEQKEGGSGADALRRVKVAVNAVQGMSIDALLEELGDEFEDEDFDDVETLAKPIAEGNEPETDSKSAASGGDELKVTAQSSGVEKREKAKVDSADDGVGQEMSRRRRLTDKMGESGCRRVCTLVDRLD